MAKFQMLRYLFLMIICLYHLVLSVDLHTSTSTQVQSKYESPSLIIDDGNYNYRGGSVFSVMGFDEEEDEDDDDDDDQGYGNNDKANYGNSGNHNGYDIITTTESPDSDDIDDTTTTEGDQGANSKHSKQTNNESGESSSSEGTDELSSILRDGAGILVVVGLILLPIILIIIAACYNSQFEGSDAPNYTSIWTGFTNIADFYTDIVFGISLFWHQKWELFTYACICLIISHSISNIVGIYYLKKWRFQQVIYFLEYSPLVIMFNLFGMQYIILVFM